tara:strand:+ start:6763 stop:13959 length:7197 start_codon:yes stop_codon:yes gene_type:complete
MATKLSENTIPRFDHKNVNDLKSILVERKFGRPEDYIEINILDLRGDLLLTLPEYTEYTSPQGGDLTNEVNIDPLSVLNSSGFSTGTYRLNINIQKRKIFNSKLPPFTIKEISSTRRELKIYTTTFPDSQLENNSQRFISEVKNSPYFRDFILKFEDNVNSIGVNIDLDTEDPNQYYLLIKTYKSLPDNIEVGDKLSIVEDIVEPVILTYDLGQIEPTDNTIPLRGPNFKIDTRLNSSLPTAFKSYDDILSTENTSSYQKLISRLDGYEIPEIEYDYIRPIDTASDAFNSISPSHFENFIHFGSAVERLNSFEYKVKLIELYDTQLQETLSISGSTSISQEIRTITASINDKKTNLIQGFDGYEQFLYFTTGSNPYTWPKTTITEPYTLVNTTSDELSTWFGSGDSKHPYYGGQMLSASTFDSQNQNRLFKMVPHFIGDNPDNEPFLLFCDMVGNHFDPIWAHIKEISQIRNNEHKYGVSKNLVHYALKTLGIEAYDQFENEDLASYIFGSVTTSENSTVITGSNEVISKQDATKEVWKRLYHNAPYLLKTKGTERGLRALINCYGIPDTILDIKEYGSSNPDRDDTKIYSYNKYNKVLGGDSKEHEGFFIETNWSSSEAIALSASAKTVEFRVKPVRTDNQYHLFSLSGSVSSSDLHLLVHPYTGSYDFFHPDDRTQYGKLELHQFTSSIAESSGVGEIVSPTELINNGSFDERLGPQLANTNNSANYGANSTINSTNTITWTATTGTESGTIVPSGDLVVGAQYLVKATVSNYVVGNGGDDIGFATATVGTTARRSDDGEIYHHFINAGGAGISMFCRDGASGTLSNISVQRVNADNLTSITGQGIHTVEGGQLAISESGYTYSQVMYAGLDTSKTYQTTFDITLGTGTFAIYYTENGQISLTSDGTYTFNLKNADRLYVGRNGGTGDKWYMDNISLKEVLIPEEGYFPIYNGEFWDLYLNTDGASGSNAEVGFGAYQSNYLREVSSYTSSINITERENAEAFGNPYYGGGSNKAGSEKTYFCGIRDFTQNQQLSQSNYSVANSGSAFGLEYTGSLSEVRFYFGERLSHKTLSEHALEPLMYNGNSISSSYDSLILRFPLSFELELNHDTSTQLPSSSVGWNNSPTDTTGLVTPASNIGLGTPLQGQLTGGAVLSSSLDPFQTTSSLTQYSGQYFDTGSVPPGPPTYIIAGTPLLQSHHPNEDVNYLDGFTYMGPDQIESVVELHHLPTPNTIGKSAVNRKIYIDSGSTDDDILSPDILSQLPTSDRQVPDFDHLGIFFSPQNELNEDIIYTLGTFSLDHTLGDPRQQTSSDYSDLTSLSETYFKKLGRKTFTNQFDFIRWIQFTDHTLFEMIKQFVPQKANLKAGLLIEPHYLERSKFQRFHPNTQHTHSPTSSLYEATIREIDRPLSASFKQGNYNGKRIGYNNISALDATSGSAVISHTTTNYSDPELISNGNFNNGLEGWKLPSNTAASATQTITAGALSLYSGTAGDNNNNLTKTFLKSPGFNGRQYKLTITAFDFISSAQGTIRLNGVNNVSNQINFFAGTQEVTFTAHSDFTSIQFHASSHSDSYTIDNVSLIELGKSKPKGIDSTLGYNTTISPTKQFIGNSAWEQGPLLPAAVNSNLDSSKASLFLNFSNNTGENMYITLTSADGTVRTYKAADTSDPAITHGTVLADSSIAFDGLGTSYNKANSLRSAILSDNGHGGKFTVVANPYSNNGKITITQTIPGTVGNTLITQGFTSGLNDFDHLLDGTGKVRNFEGGGLPKVPRYRISDNSNELRPWALTPYGNFMNSRVSKRVRKSIAENNTIKLVDSAGKNFKTQFTVNANITLNTSSFVLASAAINAKTNTGLSGMAKIGRRYRLKFTISGYSGSGKIFGRIITKDGHTADWTKRSANGTYIETVTIKGVSSINQYNRFYFQVADAAFTGTISDMLLEEINPQRDVEFDDSLIDMASWKLPRYEGSKLTGAKINKYTPGDITYGLNPVINQNSSVLYFGKTATSADGEDDSLTTIKGHTYIDIEKMIVIDKKRDKITVLEPKNETYGGMNRYISKDLGPGSSFHIELLDEGIANKLKNTYTSKFNQGYLFKVLEHKGINGGGSVSQQGIQVGYVDTSTEPFPYKSTDLNVFSYAKHTNTINSDTIVLKENTLTKKIFPNYQSFGQIDFITGSTTNNYYDSVDNLSMFVNSMLIPVASESQHRLFGTFNYGQPIQVADYTIEANRGLKSISTCEFDLESYVVTSSLHDQISGSSNMRGFGRALVRPDHTIIPIMRGPHDLITDKKIEAGITWPGNGGNTGTSHNGATTVELQYYFNGSAEHNAIYQISYLEESQTIIADIDKPIELANNVGDKGYIIIPDNLDTEIKDNLDYWLEQSGYKTIKVPKNKEDKVPPRNG